MRWPPIPNFTNRRNIVKKVDLGNPVVRRLHPFIRTVLMAQQTQLFVRPRKLKPTGVLIHLAPDYYLYDILSCTNRHRSFVPSRATFTVMQRTSYRRPVQVARTC